MSFHHGQQQKWYEIDQNKTKKKQNEIFKDEGGDNLSQPTGHMEN